ncbi:MAG: CDP-alcohol phosphatidyltransferase family protein [Microbacteriaceae bacterium]|nr:CDP-alcohol phosphatidyltransferase family protein [Microbacteriaceae bacterium]
MDQQQPAKRPAEGLDRCEIPQRTSGWATRIADALAAMRLTPNTISVISVAFAAIAAACLVASAFVGDDARWSLLTAAAVLLPLRLLCNMLDGMLAVEHDLRTPTGDLFNELPDRIADLVVLAAAGYATAGVWMLGATDVGVALGWTAAALALLTAYVRTLGAANGVGNFFDGPMAKPPRMWAVVAAALVSLAEPLLDWPRGVVLAVALAVIAVGALVTVLVRLRRIVAALRAREARP